MDVSTMLSLMFVGCHFTSFFLPSPSPLLSLLLLLSLSPPLGECHCCCFSLNEIPKRQDVVVCMHMYATWQNNKEILLHLRFLPWIYLSFTSKSADYKRSRAFVCVCRVVSCLIRLWAWSACSCAQFRHPSHIVSLPELVSLSPKKPPRKEPFPLGSRPWCCCARVIPHTHILSLSVFQFLPGEYILHILRMFSAVPADLRLAPAYEARSSRPRGPLLTGTSLIYIAIRWTNMKINITSVCVCCVCVCVCLDFPLSLKVLNPTLSWYFLYVFVVVEREESRDCWICCSSSLLFSSRCGPLRVPWVVSHSLTYSLSRHSRMLTEHKHTRA